jgi:hypothetical protein
MHNLTVAVQIKNITKFEVVAVSPNGKKNEANVIVECQDTDGNVYLTCNLVIQNGVCQGVRPKVGAVGYFDRLETFTVTIAAGFDELVATYRPGTDAAGRRAVEVWMASKGLFPAGS